MEQNELSLPYPDHDPEVLQLGKRFGYGRWLQPIINSNDGGLSSPEMLVEDQDHQSSITPRRGRGRPRVTKPRDQSAIEKRRAQVREAQRTYQKRKDDAAATEKKRVDELLQVMSDLCSDVESLLELASQNGIMDQNDEVGMRLRHLWTSYDTAINSHCVKPELRLLQLKNDRRRAGHHDHASPGHMVVPEEMHQVHGNHTPPPTDVPEHGDLSERALQICGINETTLLQPYMRVAGPTARIMGGRSIFDVVAERQAIFNNTRRPSP